MEHLHDSDDLTSTRLLSVFFLSFLKVISMKLHASSSSSRLLSKTVSFSVSFLKVPRKDPIDLIPSEKGVTGVQGLSSPVTTLIMNYKINMRNDAYAASISAKCFYVGIHMFIILVFCEYPTELSASCANLEYSCLMFGALKLIACTLYFICCFNPGVVKDGALYHELELETEDDWNPPQLEYCDLCKVLKPYRARHCGKCELCIAKFDHHCF